jgi:hypothetical protein
MARTAGVHESDIEMLTGTREYEDREEGDGRKEWG